MQRRASSAQGARPDVPRPPLPPLPNSAPAGDLPPALPGGLPGIGLPAGMVPKTLTLMTWRDLLKRVEKTTHNFGMEHGATRKRVEAAARVDEEEKAEEQLRSRLVSKAAQGDEETRWLESAAASCGAVPARVDSSATEASGALRRQCEALRGELSAREQLFNRDLTEYHDGVVNRLEKDKGMLQHSHNFLSDVLKEAQQVMIEDEQEKSLEASRAQPMQHKTIAEIRDELSSQSRVFLPSQPEHILSPLREKVRELDTARRITNVHTIIADVIQVVEAACKKTSDALRSIAQWQAECTADTKKGREEVTVAFGNFRTVLAEQELAFGEKVAAYREAYSAFALHEKSRSEQLRVRLLETLESAETAKDPMNNFLMPNSLEQLTSMMDEVHDSGMVLGYGTMHFEPNPTPLLKTPLHDIGELQEVPLPPVHDYGNWKLPEETLERLSLKYFEPDGVFFGGSGVFSPHQDDEEIFMAAFKFVDQEGTGGMDEEMLRPLVKAALGGHRMSIDVRNISQQVFDELDKSHAGVVGADVFAQRVGTLEVNVSAERDWSSRSRGVGWKAPVIANRVLRHWGSQRASMMGGSMSSMSMSLRQQLGLPGRAPVAPSVIAASVNKLPAESLRAAPLPPLSGSPDRPDKTGLRTSSPITA